MKEHIKRVDRILKYKGSILDIYTDVIETPDGHRAEWDYIDHRGVFYLRQCAHARRFL